jgi:hypothetical protein
MVRTSMLTVAVVVLTGAVASPAAPPPEAVRKGFRVYTTGIRCGARRLVGIYETAGEAFRVAAEHRAKLSPERVEVTTGTEGKQTPDGRPALFHLYTMANEKNGWAKQPLMVDEREVQVAVKEQEKKGVRVEVVHDYAPKEVFHIFGGGCSRSWRLWGTYVTGKEACEAAEAFRTKEKSSGFKVTTGADWRHPLAYRFGSPTRYTVYARAGEGDWTQVETTNDGKKAQEVLEARKKENVRVEVVEDYTSK